MFSLFCPERGRYIPEIRSVNWETEKREGAQFGNGADEPACGTGGVVCGKHCSDPAGAGRIEKHPFLMEGVLNLGHDQSVT